MDILELNKKAWDKVGEDVFSPHINEGKYLKMFNFFCDKLQKGASVLDLGCGPGIPITKELVKRGFNVTGVDISDNMIKLARKNVPEAKYFRMSMTNIDFTKEFDGVLSNSG